MELLRQVIIDLKISEQANKKQAGELMIHHQSKQLEYMAGLDESVQQQLHEAS